jgi:5-deoxy-glucuronate isomerase
MSGLLRRSGEFPAGYTPLCAVRGPHGEMGMDFGILRLGPGETWSPDPSRERAALLLGGEVGFEWEGGRAAASRGSLFDEPPSCLHVPTGCRWTVRGGSGGAELAIQAAENAGEFPPRLYAPGECRSEQRGKGTMGETATRIVRTIFDDTNAPLANLVLGEVITYPGKWSSYPPHHHPQPEIYHYRFLPPGGYGLTAAGEQAFVLRHGDTLLIHPGEDHPQVAAPGYAMYYLWVIRHLDGRRYGTPEFTPDHEWVADRQAKIWPSGR